jgi:hypothetical protein
VAAFFRNAALSFSSAVRPAFGVGASFAAARASSEEIAADLVQQIRGRFCGQRLFPIGRREAGGEAAGLLCRCRADLPARAKEVEGTLALHHDRYPPARPL